MHSGRPSHATSKAAIWMRKNIMLTRRTSKKSDSFSYFENLPAELKARIIEYAFNDAFVDYEHQVTITFYPTAEIPVVSPTSWQLYHVDRLCRSELMRLSGNRLYYAFRSGLSGFDSTDVVYFNPKTDTLELDFQNLGANTDLFPYFTRLSPKLLSCAVQVVLHINHETYMRIATPSSDYRDPKWLSLFPKAQKFYVHGYCDIRELESMSRVENFKRTYRNRSFKIRRNGRGMSNVKFLWAGLKSDGIRKELEEYEVELEEWHGQDHFQ